MQNTVAQQLAAVAASGDREALRPLLNALADRMSSQALATAGLVIKAGGGVLAKVGATDFQAVANGKHVTIAASTDMPALTGLSIGAGKFNVAVFYVDSAGTKTVGFGTEGATAAAVKFPQTPEGKAIIGYLMITYASAFTGNSTALDTATTIYVSPVGAFDPSISLG
jgi:hypothetical protein